mmetsp:Transcript_1562/g.1780  ORF Transcript_1562/g.1780 Transcript_1562/m.1780 type:complete len:340 (+) Transcript_1562:39-1058(+)
MAFSRAGRFGNGSYLDRLTRERSRENSSPNVHRGRGKKDHYAGLKFVTVAPGTPENRHMPAYMRSTASSARKTANKDIIKSLEDEEDSTLPPLPKFGEDTKGGSGLMKKGRHGRFSIATSFYVQNRGAGADNVGIGHGDIATGKGATFLGKNKADRFGTGSYLEKSSKSGTTSEFLIGHTDLGSKDTYQRSAAFMPSNLDKSEWLTANTVLADKDMKDCEGRNNVAPTTSDFETSYSSEPSAVFKDRSKRFQTQKREPGMDSIGLTAKSDFDSDPKCGAVYKKSSKHSRFSMIGGIHHVDQTKSPSSASVGDRFASRILERTWQSTITEGEEEEEDTDN